MHRNAFAGRGWFVVAFLIGIVFVATSGAFAGKLESFSADQVFIDAKGNVEQTTKIYMTPQKARMGGMGPGGKVEMVVMVRKDLGLYRMLNVKKKVYFERPLNEDDLSKLKASFKRGQEVDLGWEKVSGYKCRKKQITITTEIMGFKRKSQSTIWVSDKLDLPLRTQDSDGSITELRNIKKGKPPEELFEIPKGWRKSANMMEMFAGPPEQGGAETRNESAEGESFADKLRKNLPEGFKLPFGN